jgi:hypothetical protein
MPHILLTLYALKFSSDFYALFSLQERRNEESSAKEPASAPTSTVDVAVATSSWGGRLTFASVSAEHE